MSSENKNQILKYNVNMFKTVETVEKGITIKIAKIEFAVSNITLHYKVTR